jgi:hypothetical protein
VCQPFYVFETLYFKLIMLPTLFITNPNLEIFLFCQHNSTGGGNLQLRQTIGQISFLVFFLSQLYLLQKVENKEN